MWSDHVQQSHDFAAAGPHGKQPGSEELRQRAEAAIAGKQVDFQTLPPEQAAELAHELQIHQIELEIQNEELRRAQEKLALAHDRYADLYDYAPVAYLTVDAEGKVVAANLTAADLLGMERGDVIGQPLSRFVTRDDQDALHDHHRHILKHGYQRCCVLTMVKADGAKFDALLDSAIAPADDGGFYHWRTVVKDVTERRRIEETLAQMRHRQAIEDLAGGIAHDFNNLLTAVMAAHSLATIDRAEPDRLLGHLEVIGEGLATIRDLVDELMALSSDTPSEKAAIALPDQVETACGTALADGEVRCHQALGPRLWPVLGNARLLSRALHHLVSNARDAIPGGGLIRITADNAVILPGQLRGLNAGHYVKLSIADAGRGIPEKHLTRLFDPYFSTKRRGDRRGIGLGLAVCHAIIAEHDGTIVVDSQIGVGTTFHVYLPAADAPIPMGRERSGETRRRGGSGRVLVMDDQEVMRAAACEMLTRLGYTPVAAHDGEEAVRLYREALDAGQPFAAVILDLTVRRGIGGKAAIGELLALDPHATVLISSGYTSDPIMADYATHGFRGALPKPYGLAELGHALSTVLGEE
jgi:two-component system cell cycle sensor histidine kinase/response regulator CckA